MSWNQGGLWSHLPQPSWTDVEWQIRNWLYFTWLSGDHIVEQHVHNIDVMNWVLSAHPMKAIGHGRPAVADRAAVRPHLRSLRGRLRIPERRARHRACAGRSPARGHRVGESFIGHERTFEQRGQAEITGAQPVEVRAQAKPSRPYVQEHTDLIASIRAGKPINELKQVAESTLTAIMGREAAYTGQEMTWDAVLNADQVLAPPEVGFVPLAVPPVPMPGKTKLNRKWNE